MNEGDGLSLGANSRSFVDQPNAGGPAPIEGRGEIIDCKADVVDPGASAGDEFSDRSVVSLRLEQLDQRPACLESLDTRSVRIGDFHLIHPKYVAEERELCLNRWQRNANMRDSCSLWGFLLH